MVLHEDELNEMLDKHVLAGAIKKVRGPISHMKGVDQTKESNIIVIDLQVLQEHEPLLTYHLYDQFIEVEGKSEEAERETGYNHLIILLPPTNRDLLAFVIRHLRQV